MNPKKIKKIRNLVKKLVRQMLDDEPFRFTIPKNFKRNFLCEQFTEKQRKIIADWASAVRSKTNQTEKLHAGKRSLANHGDTFLEMLPLPAPNVIVLLDDRLIRYEVAAFLYKKGIFLSLSQAAASENGIGIAGINMSGKERGMVQRSRQLTARKFLKKPIYIDRTSRWNEQLACNTRACIVPPTEQIAAAIRETPTAVIWAILMSLLATVMPLLQEDAKPFFYPALRLSDNESAAELQYDALRNVLGGFAFGHSDGQCALRLLELTLQEKKDIATLEKVCGQPVLVRLDKEPVQRELTRQMQNRHCELLACGIAKHPLQTLPILTGEALPSDNTICALDWPAFETVNPQAIAVLRKAFGACLKKASDLAYFINDQITHLHLDGVPYTQAYLWAVALVLDGVLFDSTEQCGTLTSWMQGMIAAQEQQEAERERRFALAANILRDPDQYGDVVAPSAREMTPAHLGFCYTNQHGEQFIAFELKTDFSKLLVQCLNMRASDSLPFRQYLDKNGLMQSVGKNVRGRNGDPVPHALILTESVCETSN